MKKIFAVLFAAAVSASAFCQNTAFLDLRQDVSLMRSELGQLRMEVEQLRLENEQLKRAIDALKSSSVASESVRTQVSSVKASVSAQNEALKREIIARVKKDIDALAVQTDAAIQKLANAVGARPAPAAKTSFSTDYPKTGINYVVVAGDSVSKIARKYNSRTDWILNANEISDPRDLRVGASIFIPQK